MKTAVTRSEGPLIPLDTIDAPQQRLYVVAFYIALFAWRLYDFNYLQEEDTESLWGFMKWVAIDGVFLFGLPELRIPWLEWSSATMTFVFLGHALLNGILMFRIPLPVGAGFAALGKVFYDRELAISERHVKHSSIMHNESLILGKQIIHILPEGSATLNPGKKSFCLDKTHPQVYLPIQINQTTPIGIDLLHVDFETNQNETIHLSSSQIKKMIKEAQRNTQSISPDQPLTLRYPVKETGLYMLHKVVDESKLEVRRRRTGDTLVAACPQAIIKPLSQHRCRGDLSNVELEVVGTPPLQVRYRKMINKVEHEAHLQSIQPEDFASPLTQQDSDALVLRGNVDVSWARPQAVLVPLSEGMGTSGRWVFSLEEVQDALGNVVSYTERDHDSQEKPRAKSPQLHQEITVHERPTAMLSGFSPERPLKVARGSDASLPVQLSSLGKGGFLDAPYQLEYLFTPEGELSPTGDHTASAKVKSVSVKDMNQRPSIRDPGLYTLSAVSSEFCLGEVLEPASCFLQNPPEPSIKLQTEEIFDKCAHKAIGLRVGLDLTGTPPFRVHYLVERRGEGHGQTQQISIAGLRGQLELTPPTAGHYTYRFTDISDATYNSFSIRDQNLVLEQDVKPSAYASFVGLSAKQNICIDQSVRFKVALRGEGPFSVEYELVRGNKRIPYKISDIQSNEVDIETIALSKGGDYTLSLASVTDSMGCKEFLKEEAKISVRNQKPKAGFGQVEGGRSIKTLEGRKLALPLKLTGGDGPWTIQYRNIARPEHEMRVELRNPNDKIDVQEEGTYQITSVRDAVCPGTVDESINTFDVKWIGRPSMRVSEHSFAERSGDRYIKHDVCQGEDDSMDLHFSGSPPFEVKYEEHIQPDSGKKAFRTKALNAALGVSSIRMDTSQAGVVEYNFKELGDYNYDHDSKHFSPINIRQRVHPRPMAAFVTPGKTYSYCSTESEGEEVIPIKLSGAPPFTVDVEIKHHGTARPEIVTISDIPSATHDLRVPHSKLHLGTSAIAIRKVSDSRGCGRTLDSNQPRVQIAVHDAPSITPMEQQTDFCVGDRISYSLSGQAPFTIVYDFNGVSRKASVSTNTFRRLAKEPGAFTITSIQDSASGCKAAAHLAKQIHGMPSVQVSKGKESYVDIHEGGEAEITFDFTGTPPFEFTWTRSTNARKGHRSQVLEMRSDASEEYSMTIRASEEGTYEVVSIKDRHCAYAKDGVDFTAAKKGKLLTY